jgi:hypothetical protein
MLKMKKVTPLFLFYLSWFWIQFSIHVQGFSQTKGSLGFSGKSFPASPCVDHAWHAAWMDSLETISKKYPYSGDEKAFLKMRWPLKWAPGFGGRSFYGISNYFDLNPATGALLDFNCGNRTYDLGTYSHNGTDIFLWPMWWKSMAEGQVDVVAAAKGIVLQKIDGQFDQQCVWTNATWNVVVVKHSDTLSTLYGHLKKNSLTSKAIGDTVQEGEYLGKVGSSGRSNGPHLHFETLRLGQAFDPWRGPCNLVQSRWKAQPSYFDPFLNHVETSAGLPVFPPCPQVEDMRSKDTFQLADTVFITHYFRDLRTNDTLRIKLIHPNGQAVDSLKEALIFPEGFFDAAYWTFYWLMPTNAQGGNWKFEVRYYQNRDTARFYWNGPLSVQNKIPKKWTALSRGDGIWEFPQCEGIRQAFWVNWLGQKKPLTHRGNQVQISENWVQQGGFVQLWTEIGLQHIRL